MALMSFWLVLALFLDQLSKKIIVEYLEPHQTINIIGDFIAITNVKNTGISFGMFQGFTHILVPLVFVIIFIVFLISLKFIRRSPWLAFSFGSIIGGALGNQIDRLFKGAVVDFLSVNYFAVFNVSDSFVVIGAVVLGVHTLFYSEHYQVIDWTDYRSITSGIANRFHNGYFRNTRKINVLQRQFMQWLTEMAGMNKIIVWKTNGDSSPDLVISNALNESYFSNDDHAEREPILIVENCYENDGQEADDGLNQRSFLGEGVPESSLNQHSSCYDYDSMMIYLNQKGLRKRYLLKNEKELQKFSVPADAKRVMRLIIVNDIKKNINAERSQEIMNNDFILEILIEEIPPSEIESLQKQMKEGISNLLEQTRIKNDGVEFFYAARRFGVHVKNISDKQDDGEEVKRGPAKKIAFDGENVPSKALNGFLRGNNAVVGDIIVKEENGVDYCYIQRKIVGRSTAEVLKERLPEFLYKLNFKKPMKWADGQYKFVRPVHNVLAVIGTDILDFEFMGKKATNKTEGHRFLSFTADNKIQNNEISVGKADEYFEIMKEKCVYAYQSERKDKILRDIKAVEEIDGVIIPLDNELVEEVTSLTEFPTPVVGDFNRKYLELPKEVLITTLKHHQRTFPVLKQSTLMNQFLSFKDNVDEKGKASENVKKGYRKVIEARLEDALFYYKEDMKIPFEERDKLLESIGFQNKLGNMLEKVNRNGSLAITISDKLDLTEESKKLVSKAAALMKNDLTTHMVYEFPELQGIMGRIYSKLDGEPFEVSQAIEEQYSDRVPETYVGCIVTLTDNLDTIAGNLLIKNIPSGSKDPFALRRALTRILNIIIDREWDFDLIELFAESVQLYHFNLSQEQLKKLKEIFAELLKNRVDYFLNENGIEYDVINAVSHLNSNPLRSYLAAQALMSIKMDEDFFDLAKLFERVHNITKTHSSCDYDSRLFENEEERTLETEFVEIKEVALKKINSFDYKGAFETVKKLTATINNYFDNVFVMSEREDLKLTRLGFLKNLDNFFMKTGNLSEIVIVSREN